MRQGLWNKASFRKYTQLDHADRLRDAPFQAASAGAKHA
jgi:hypothetical protein